MLRVTDDLLLLLVSPQRPQIRLCVMIVIQSNLWYGKPGSPGSVRAISMPCSGLIPFVLTILPFIFHTRRLLFFLYLLLPFVSPMLFPCERYAVWYTQLVRGIPVPYSLYYMVPFVSCELSLIAVSVAIDLTKVIIILLVCNISSRYLSASVAIYHH